jgi:hypothetical protein
MVMKESSMKLVDKICEVIARRIISGRAGSPAIWPIPVMEPYWYLKKAYLRDLYFLLKTLKEKGVQKERIAKLFLSPTRICFNFYYFVNFPLSDSGLSVEERVALLKDLVEFASFYRKEDVFCEKGRDIIWTQKYIKEVLKKYKFIDLAEHEKGKEFKELMGQLNGALWLYEEYINVIRHQHSHQFHGPYQLEDGEVLLVREHFDLKPTIIWPFTSELPFDRLTTLEVYRDVKVTLNCFNNIDSSTALPQHLQKVAILENEQQILDLSKVRSYLEEIQKVLTKGYEFTANYTKRDWLKKYIDLTYYSLKPLKDILREDWRPPEEIYRLVETEDASQHVKKIIESARGAFQKGEEEGIQILKEIFLKNIFAK